MPPFVAGPEANPVFSGAARRKEVVEAPGTTPPGREEQDYCKALLRATMNKLYRLQGDAADDYELQYTQAAALGDQLRAWRNEYRLNRVAAAAVLPGWSETSIALLEQAMLLPTEISSVMARSLCEVGIRY